MIKNCRLASILLVLLIGLSACNLPASTQEPEGPGAVLTAAAQTVEANLTQLAVQNTPTVSIQLTSTPVLVTVTPAVASPTAGSPTSGAPAATGTSDCDDADFVTDVTIPDGTVLDPNETFTKTWRLKNSGTCSWTPSYAVVFSNGDSMGGPATQALTGNVNPGQTMDISVNLKAPATPGDYTGYWKLRNAAGVTFATFYVTIKVSGGGPFAVTSVNYTLSTWSDASHTDCPRITASITTNGTGTIEYEWTSTSGTDPKKTLTFASAGTQSINFDLARGSVWAGTPESVGIYIHDPNHQDFGKKDFTTACTSP